MSHEKLRAGATYHVATFGCQMNEADTQRLASELERLGMQHTAVREEADVLVLNTCVVRQGAEDKANSYLHMIHPLKQARPEMIVGVMGCLVGVRGNTPLKRAFPWVDVFMAPSEPAPMVDYLVQLEAKRLADAETEQRFALQDGDLARAIAPGGLLLPADQIGKQVTAHVPIVLGCSHACTFCIIPHRRGAERSRAADEIVRDVESLVAQGVKEVTLLGQIVDRYGYDLLGDDYAIRTFNPGAASGIPSQNLALTAPLISLLERVNAVAGLERVRFLTSHPNWMTDDLLDAVRELPKLMPYIEVPVQAGDDDVLKRMRRGYTSDDYRRLIARIREKVPHAAIATDIIVGFCGESEAQFMHTHDLLEELRLDIIHLARYSTRPNTLAEREFADDVPADEKMRRFQMLENQHERITNQINQRFVGERLAVLVDSQHKGRWRGRTPHNKLVFFEDASQSWLGRVADVSIESASAWSMRGVL
jgi:tRNA-2-methylthio-N6-dimethylallyladenosine synthase